MRFGKPERKNGDTRTRIRFAYTPVRTDGGEWLWLERYVHDERWTQLLVPGGQWFWGWWTTSVRPAPAEGETE